MNARKTKKKVKSYNVYMRICPSAFARMNIYVNAGGGGRTDDLEYVRRQTLLLHLHLRWRNVLLRCVTDRQRARENGKREREQELGINPRETDIRTQPAYVHADTLKLH